MSDNHQYDDIINLPHHTSVTRPRMSALDRAAQFSPFAALTGYDAAVQETARLTDSPIELDESGKAMLNEKIQMVMEMIDEQPELTITYFVPDERKTGGAYVSATGKAGNIDEYHHAIVLTDGTAIRFEQIREIEGVLFQRLY